MIWAPWLCLFLAVLGDAAKPAPAAPVPRPNMWAVGDIFVTSQGALHTIDGATFQIKKTFKLKSRQGQTLCPGQIAGGAFNEAGTLLYLTCESDAKVIVLAGATGASHAVLRNFTTSKSPSSIAVDRSGMLYISHSDSSSGVVDWYSPQEHYIGRINLKASGEAITGLKLAQTPNGTELVASTRGSSLPTLHKFNMQHWQELANVTEVPSSKQCHGMEILPNGSTLVACEACVFHMVANTTGPAKVTRKYCPRRASLRAVASDPTGAFFYALDTPSGTIHKVSLSTWRAKATVTLADATSAKGLLVLQKVDEALVSAKKKPVNATTDQDHVKKDNASGGHSSDEFLAIG